MQVIDILKMVVSSLRRDSQDLRQINMVFRDLNKLILCRSRPVTWKGATARHAILGGRWMLGCAIRALCPNIQRAFFGATVAVVPWARMSDSRGITKGRWYCCTASTFDIGRHGNDFDHTKGADGYGFACGVLSDEGCTCGAADVGGCTGAGGMGSRDFG